MNKYDVWVEGHFTGYLSLEALQRRQAELIAEELTFRPLVQRLNDFCPGWEVQRGIRAADLRTQREAREYEDREKHGQ